MILVTHVCVLIFGKNLLFFTLETQLEFANLLKISFNYKLCRLSNLINLVLSINGILMFLVSNIGRKLIRFTM